jgi:purine-binding chemotaxis protein CheW
MNGASAAQVHGATLEIIAVHRGDQQFCIKTISIREIRGGAAATPLPMERTQIG